jgi:hypothetical protein
VKSAVRLRDQNQTSYRKQNNNHQSPQAQCLAGKNLGEVLGKFPGNQW